jgi:tRNA U34 5-methylaminomethyl-2-thiouridine-forming methyltransferase MnmC
MERQVVLTKDGSHTISIPELNVTYHSIHGAIQESQHIFIEAGLKASDLFSYIGVHHVLEVGFGTGLNALLTLIEADKEENRIYYTGIDLYPLHEQQAALLNYCTLLQVPDYQRLFMKMHEGPWNEMFEITEFFRLTKVADSILNFTSDNLYSVIYFDAFAPSAQPELWTKEVFEKLFNLLHPEGLLLTYCSKGDVRRAMQAAGFTVEKIPGPPGKREILRARKKAEGIS